MFSSIGFPYSAIVCSRSQYRKMALATASIRLFSAVISRRCSSLAQSTGSFWTAQSQHRSSSRLLQPAIPLVMFLSFLLPDTSRYLSVLSLPTDRGTLVSLLFASDNRSNLGSMNSSSGSSSSLFESSSRTRNDSIRPIDGGRRWSLLELRPSLLQYTI